MSDPRVKKLAQIMVHYSLGIKRGQKVYMPDPRHNPSNARREARKLDTQAMYKDWRKAFRDWQKKRPGMSDVWYSQQIAKMEISCKRDSETIRKHMKK